MTNTEKENLKRVNFAVHEAGHICAACSRNLPVHAEIGVVITNMGRLGAQTWHCGGTCEDDLFILYAGIKTTERFSLGESGTLKDVRDIEEIAAELPNPESTKQFARSDADIFVSHSTDIILKMAYMLYQNGTLDHQMTRKIYDGEIGVIVSLEFLDTLEVISKLLWQLVKSEPVRDAVEVPGAARKQIDNQVGPNGGSNPKKRTSVVRPSNSKIKVASKSGLFKMKLSRSHRAAFLFPGEL